MRRSLALMTIALAACGKPPPPPPPPAPPAPPLAVLGDTVVVGDFEVTAVGEREGEVLHVQRLEIRAPGRPEPVQVIDGLQTDTPWPPSAPGLEAVDMDFDGHPDLRLIEFRAAGPNTPWRHWLYDPAQQRFGASAALDALSPTRYDGARRRVIVDWRDGAARQGRDTYAWREGRLEPATMAR
jgi:hypothetical protein